MTTRFSLELTLDKTEQLRLFQIFEYLENIQAGGAEVPPELTEYLPATESVDNSLHERFADLIGSDLIGIGIVQIDDHRVRIFDTSGKPNLRMLCQIIGNFVPRVLPIEFTFAVIDEEARHFSGGLVVMTHTSAEIQVVDSKLKGRSKKVLH